MPSPEPLHGPVPETSRINAIDVVRGFALLGIFMVNAQFFAEPIGTYLRHAPPVDASAADAAAFYLVKALGEGKFYPLFSLLFGMGLALQWRRAKAVGRALWATGLRRLLVLGLLGLTHGLLLWYGDILFIYSTAGVLLLLLIAARPRTLVLVGSGLMAIAVVLSAGMGALAVLSTPPVSSDALEAVEVNPETTPQPTPPADDALPHDHSQPQSPNDVETSEPHSAPPVSPFDRALRILQDPQAMQGVGGPTATQTWMEAETEAYQNGPYLQTLLFRIFSFAFYMIYAVLGFWWHVAAMFCFGAAMLKAGIFDPRNAHWLRRMGIFGLTIGVPIGLLYALMPMFAPEKIFWMFGGALVMIGGPILSLGYLGAIATLVSSGRLRKLTSAIACVGRMALTNYLMQTIIATAIFYYWGLGLFGKTTPIERVAIILAVYAAQIPVSVLWLRAFRFGPMEWVWRSLTYLHPQPLMRRSSYAATTTE